MAKSIYGKTKAEVAFNMTPMIDCTFQLIIFFMLVTQMVSSEYVKLNLPKPTVNQALQLDERHKVIVNVIPYRKKEIAANPNLKGKAKGYSVKSARLKRSEAGRLRDLLIQARRRARQAGFGDDFVVEVRADRSMHYLEVLPVLEAVQAAEIEKMRITAVKATG